MSPTHSAPAAELTFEVAARDGTSDDVLAEGTITRAVVDTERFLARLRT